jgi:hypothetical protein
MDIAEKLRKQLISNVERILGGKQTTWLHNHILYINSFVVTLGWRSKIDLMLSNLITMKQNVHGGLFA